jgi:hypothetical protein
LITKYHLPPSPGGDKYFFLTPIVVLISQIMGNCGHFYELLTKKRATTPKMVLKSEEMGQYNKSHQFRSMILAARDLKVFFKSNDDFDLEKLLKLKS